jgi:hypothetical protein
VTACFQPDLFAAPGRREPVPAHENGWFFAIYRGAICWIGLAQRAPFRGRERHLCPRTGRFAFGDTRDEAVSNLREVVGA